MQKKTPLFNKLILVFIFVIFTKSGAQNLKFNHYNDNGGLSHNSVRHIVQDKNGFLWIGTFSGLNRFDGYEFKTYLSTSEGLNKINNDDVTALEFDEASNNLWIGTRKGLTLLKFDTHEFVTFLNNESDSSSLPDNEIRSIYVDKYKRVWVGTKEKGVYLFYLNENRFEKINLPGFNYIKEIFEDALGNIWIGSYNMASVAKISLDSVGNIQQVLNYTLSIPNSIEINPYLNFIYEDNKNDIFVGTRQGLYKLNKGNNKFENLYNENNETKDVLRPYFISVAQAPDGKYWVGTLGGLIVCDRLEDISKGYFKRYYSVLTDQTSLTDNLVSALYFDASGMLWIGTEDGLDKYDSFENQFNINRDISKFIGGQSPRIRGFAKTYNNKIIAATRNNGLFITEGDHFVPLYNNQKDIASIYTVDGKIVYCGLWNGKILVYNYETNRSKEIDVGFEQTPISAFENLEKEKIIIGTFGEGAKILDTKNLKVISNTHLLQESDINEIVKDKFGNLWLATEAGVTKYDLTTGTETEYKSSLNTNKGLPHDNVSDIIFDNNGKLWAATRKGLSYFDVEKNNFMPLTNYGELGGKWVTDFLLDTNGDLWLNVNNNSVARINPTKNSYNTYHVNSGNRLDFFSSRGFYNYGDSNIYLGGKMG